MSSLMPCSFASCSKQPLACSIDPSLLRCAHGAFLLVELVVDVELSGDHGWHFIVRTHCELPFIRVATDTILSGRNPVQAS